MTIRKLLTTIKKYNPKADLEMVELAYEFAKKAHDGQRRATGVDYIDHALATAQNLADLKVNTNMIIAGLLHDVPEDTTYTLEDVRKNFGDDVAGMVEGVTKLGTVKYRGMKRYVENLRKMFVAMARDIRVIVIKFADRLHNLRTLYALPANKQKRIAMEVLEIYAPIANRLGIGELQAKLEDESFKYAFPDEYIWVENLIKKRLQFKQRAMDAMLKKLKRKLIENKIKYIDAYGRTKHYYSLYRKLMKSNKDIDRIYDLVAARIILKDVADCYATLGIIHSLWKPIKGKIKDYISQPKPNGYRSLHTTVFGDNQEPIEFQIRTQEMHNQAEYGIASHWHYKESKGIKEKDIAWVKELANWQKEIKDDDKFLETLKIDFFQNRIFVFTPKGDVIDLPDGATPIDFAYQIHSDVGNKCGGAYVNDIHVPLETKLKNSDVVEITLDKNRKGPNPQWLKFVKTRNAKAHIGSFKKQTWKKIISTKKSI
ncbi:MAG TPA: RelA/SpoT family protein [Candidatus Bipolaricaulota bacterium]|nr:RelA/SpoT family protein [Candidatus Bipolaricaulota bacterium]